MIKGERHALISTGEVEKLMLKIRGEDVLLDRDVAMLYGVETRIVNQAVRNNPEKFPKDYIIELNDEESSVLRSKILTLEQKRGKGRHSKYNIKAFTEKGLYMLATILKSPRAIAATLAIIETFAMTRQCHETDVGSVTSVSWHENRGFYVNYCHETYQGTATSVSWQTLPPNTSTKHFHQTLPPNPSTNPSANPFTKPLHQPFQQPPPADYSPSLGRPSDNYFGRPSGRKHQEVSHYNWWRVRKKDKTFKKDKKLRVSKFGIS